jgi:uncharacterized protein (TIGR04222 family)
MVLFAAPGDTWDISGPAFLRGYLAAAAVVLIGTLVYRHRVLRGSPATPSSSIGAQAAAYLNGGAKLAVYASLGGLRTAGAIGVSADRRLRQAGSLPADATPLDQAVYNAAGQRLRPRDLIRHDWVTDAAHRLRSEVERAGLLATADQRRAARVGPLILLGLVALGIARLVAGTANDRPAGYLILVLLVLTPATVLLLLRTPRRTRAGDDVLRRMRVDHAYLAPSQRPSWSTYGPSGAVAGVALFGAGALWAADPSFAAAVEVQRRAAASGYGDSSYTGTGTGGCGGGGGGGCGGGGCGG